MKKITTILLMMLFMASFQSATFAQISKNVQLQIEQASEALNNMQITGNVSEFQNFYTTDVISMPSHNEMISGLKALVDHNLKMKKMGFEIKTMDTKSHRYYGNSKMIVEAGSYAISFIAPTVNSAMVEEGSYVNYWVKQSGKWKVKLEIWNSSENPIEKYEEYLLGGENNTSQGKPTQKKPEAPTSGEGQNLQKNPNQSSGKTSTFDPPTTQTKEPEPQPEQPTNPNSETEPKKNTKKVKLK